jgi:hypothetical protein
MRYKNYDIEKIKQAILDYSSSGMSVKDILIKYDISHGVFYHWKRKLENNGKIQDKLRSAVKIMKATEAPDATDAFEHAKAPAMQPNQTKVKKIKKIPNASTASSAHKMHGSHDDKRSGSKKNSTYGDWFSNEISKCSPETLEQMQIKGGHSISSSSRHGSAPEKYIANRQQQQQQQHGPQIKQDPIKKQQKRPKPFDPGEFEYLITGKKI